MGKINSVNLDITNNPDGFDISGGSTSRKLTVTGGDVTLAGSGAATITFPTTSTTLAGTSIINNFTAVQSFPNGISGIGATFGGDVSITNLKMLAVGGDEGGQIDFQVPITSTSLTGNVIIDIYQNRLRIFESTGTNRGAYIDLTSASAGVGSNLLSGGTTYTPPLASTSVTGVASFNSTYYSVNGSGQVSPTAPFQVTGDTIIAGTNITISRSGNAVTVNSSGAAPGAAGSDTQIQYNASGSLSADNGLVYTTSTETLRVGSAARHIEFIPGINNYLSAFGNSNLRITQAAGNPITIGDFDGTIGNNTYLEVDDITSQISLFSSQFNVNSTANITYGANVSGGFGLSASALFVSTGATFNGNITAPNIVNSVSGITGAVILTSGTGITMSTSGKTITISSTSSGGSNTTTQTIDFSKDVNKIEFDIFTTSGSPSVIGEATREDIEGFVGLTATVERQNEALVIVGTVESVDWYTTDAVNATSPTGYLTVTMKPPFYDFTTPATTYTAEEIVSNTLLTRFSGGLGGNPPPNFDPLSITGNGIRLIHVEETYATKTVTGQSWVTADSFVTCKVLGLTTTDHDPEDAILEGVRFEINNLVVGVGFDIIGHAPEGTYGKYSVKCLGQ